MKSRLETLAMFAVLLAILALVAWPLLSRLWQEVQSDHRP